MDNHDKQGRAAGTRRPWQAPALETVGTIGKVLQGGGGKLSTSSGDPGEPMRKPKGQG